MADPTLSVRDLRVEIPTRSKTLRAVDSAGFDIMPGEILGMVGESGAGKSMTGNAIIGLLDPPAYVAGGEIRLNSRRIDGLDAEGLRRIRGREIGMIFQDPLTSLNPLLTIGRQLSETILEHLPLGRGEAEKRAIEALDEVGIPNPKNRFHSYPHEFSGGMRQRVVIALALCGEPSLVIADEPTTALDVSVQAQITALLRQVCRDRGTAILLITHDMGVIAETADRVAVMYAGRIVEIGPVRDIVSSPSHPYTDGLMSSTPSASRGRKRLMQIEGFMPRLEEIPPGCSFHPRCPASDGKCAGGAPPELGALKRDVACWHPLRAG